MDLIIFKKEPMKIKLFVFNAFQENTFVISDPEGKAMIIDPGCNTPSENETLRSYIREKNLRPLAVILTHGHVDHILGVPFCCAEWSIPVWIHRDDVGLYSQAPVYGQVFGLKVNSLPEPDKYIDEGEKLQCGEITLEILHVPGHSPGGIAFYIPEEHVLFPGDILFNGSIGRTDLPGGNHQRLVDGIRNKLLVLPGETIIWPGHGPATTIEDEKSGNPFL